MRERDRVWRERDRVWIERDRVCRRQSKERDDTLFNIIKLQNPPHETATPSPFFPLHKKLNFHIQGASVLCSMQLLTSESTCTRSLTF